MQHSASQTSTSSSADRSPDALDAERDAERDAELGDALKGPKNPSTWATHPIDIRLSVPFIRRRFYMTVVAGQERRRPDRLREDRQEYPLTTVGNVFFALGILTFMTLVALGLLIAQSAIIE